MENKEKVDEAPAKITQKVVQTFADDMAGALGESPGEAIKKIIHGEEEHEKEKENISPESAKNRLLLSFGLLFMFIAAGLFALFLFNKEAPTVAVAPQFVPLIFTDASEFLEVADLNKDQLAHTFRAAMKSSKVKVDGVDGIYITENKKVVNLSRFLTLIEANFTPDYKSVQNNFLTGFANNTTQDFFIILKVDEVANIFPAMRAWEGKMFSDLHGFFDIPLNPDTGPLLIKSFEDGIIVNKNARILYDNSPAKNIVLMYVYPDDNTVIITNSSLAVEEIITRLAQNQIKAD